MKAKINLLLLVIILNACGQSTSQETSSNERENNSKRETQNVKIQTFQELINPNGATIETRFIVPNGFKRPEVPSNSFKKYLRQLPLKPQGTKVKLYDGSVKENYDVYEAVVDLDIGKKDLQQCADAIMRLRAEYLYLQKLYDNIHFNFTNGFKVDYSEWMKGKRIVVKGNKTYWAQSTNPSNTYEDFRRYMDLIFAYAGTLSLSKELKSIKIEELEIGDIFIRGGSPGHAVIVVDVAINAKTGGKIFLLAQSYMPAQEIQILKNPNNADLSPWYSVNFGDVLPTPEWTFYNTDLKRFEE